MARRHAFSTMVGRWTGERGLRGITPKDCRPARGGKPLILGLLVARRPDQRTVATCTMHFL